MINFSKKNNNHLYSKKLVALQLLLFFFSSLNWQCQQKKIINPIIISAEDSIQEINFLQQAVSKIDSVKNLIKTGDLITRTGNDFTSQSLKTLNRRNKTYSHCGIAEVKADSIFIYHALGGEWNPNQKILKQSLKEFTDPVNNNSFGVFRYNLPDSLKRKWVAAAANYYKNEVTFDMDFDLETNDKMYCAEYVYKCFKEAAPLLSFNISKINNFKFVGVDDLFLQEYCRPVCEINYR